MKECQEGTDSYGLGKLSIPRSKASMDKETPTIAALNLKMRQYFDNPSSMSRYRTRYKKYPLSPKSTRRKKLFSIRSQMLLSTIAVGLADGMCAGIQMQYTEMLTAAVRIKRDHLSKRDLRLLTMIKEARLAMICDRSWVWIAHRVTGVY